MNKKDLYKNYISKLEEALNLENFDNIDYILEFIFSIWLEQEDLEKIDDILNEATLYAEFKENEYKDEALKLIKNFK